MLCYYGLRRCSFDCNVFFCMSCSQIMQCGKKKGHVDLVEDVLAFKNSFFMSICFWFLAMKNNFYNACGRWNKNWWFVTPVIWYNRDAPLCLPAALVLVLLLLPELQLMVELNPDLLLRDLVMMHQEGLAMMRQVFLLMIHKGDMAMSHREDLVTIHNCREGPIMMHRELDTIHREDRVMMCKEEDLAMIHQGLVIMMRSSEVLLGLMAMWRLQTMCLMGQQHHQNLLLEVETLFGDELQRHCPNI